jgi:hypothetical protein
MLMSLSLLRRAAALAAALLVSHAASAHGRLLELRVNPEVKADTTPCERSRARSRACQTKPTRGRRPGQGPCMAATTA